MAEQLTRARAANSLLVHLPSGSVGRIVMFEGLASGCEVWHICVDGTDQHFGDAAEAFALAELAPDPMTREAVELWLSS